jgi:aryl-alcohol dehydrogenase-like predicted oxidoreductase
MRYRLLGTTNLMVSELCFGAMTFVGDSGWRHLGAVGQKEADEWIGLLLDAGVNFFDTADIYSLGESEEILGKALGGRRSRAVIATKVGFRVDDGPDGDGCSRARIIAGCEASLRRLGTDHIDLYQIHSYDPLVSLEETLEALNTLVREGKVLSIGCSNFTGWQLMKALAISRKNGWAEFVSLQALYSLLTRDLELELVPLCLDQHIAILPWGPLAGGYLTGKYRKGSHWPSGTRLTKPEDHFPFDEDQAEAVLEELAAISNRRGRPVSQIALNYLLRKPGVTSLVFGARTKGQLLANIGSADWDLDPEEVARLDTLSAPPKIYPHWYFDIFRADRFREAEQRRWHNH